MQTFILNDCQNLFHRQINSVNPSFDLDSKIGMALHLILYSMRKEWNTFNGTHAVCFVEGRSWRRRIYPEYKADRKLKFATLTEKEQQDHKLLQEAFDSFIEYIDTKTNISVLGSGNAEADDMVAVFIEAHPDDKHILISSDSDFYQLLKFDNLTIYDPVKDIIIKQDGIYDDKNRRLAFSVTTNARIKIGEPDPNFTIDPDWYNYALFLKCVRGDSTDNIFSAYPGVREKGTKKTVGIREAYMDKNKGYAWNNFMQQKWTDHNNIEQQVKTRYELNKNLIDMSQIPDDIRIECLSKIADVTSADPVASVDIGVGFMKFCGAWNLVKIGSNAPQFMPLLKAKYNTKETIDV